MNSGNRFPRFKSGFTLVELLVVIAIIGILVGLLLPAVQSAREAARRMSCSNNLKNLSLSLHNYHDTYKTFPPDAIWSLKPLRKARPASGEQRNYSWIAMILPFIEQKPLHDSIDFRLPIQGQLNAKGDPIRSTRIESLECPSDPGFADTSFTHGYAWTSYAGSEGWDWWGRPGHEANGVFTYNQPGTKFAHIIDGTSNTIAIGEVGTRNMSNCKGLTGNATRAGGSGCIRSATSAVFRASLVSVVTHPTVAADTTANGGNGQLNPDGNACAFWTWASPYAYKPIYMTHRAINSTEWSSAHSLHPGGAQFGLCDGSVRFVAETVSTGNWDALGRNGNVWQAMHTIQGSPDQTPVTWQ